MKIYIQANAKGMPYNVNAYSAMQGFEQMGAETVLFSGLEDLAAVDKTDLVVGGVGRVKAFLEQRGIAVRDIDYPEQLEGFYGRKLWRTTTRQLLTHNPDKPIFVKPSAGKLFNGFIYASQRDLVGRISRDRDIDIYCSEVLDIRAEWRCFVRYGKILDIRRYTGALGLTYDLEVVQMMVEQYSDAPLGYALDVGITAQGATIVVEVNDGYSLGSYGLDPLLYAKLLAARWAELTGSVDEYNF